ncbi:ACP S-malonyltransferase [Alteriqipengyuania lutimaris]|uniref:Malonyl CoA-acyl carrier protein transacylase n=1 Tax=Alteriqipengyuania lutimaris TaxID=1538146 RepID=A0A395LHQ7_9SPHN|nr:ACP S-malonyltransferase [Alteriqipengyuania lutimaris]MBB3035153.1 [acyl-carrier-protein] S-malonyltransferase [Alteriqipengyuania lutimaris]RDS75767.1 [acyl-carrier-protein] S-malonyltransferase [Alteriqipengyuania lutimaris]
MRAFIFPGQGSQKVGMGADLADASAAARETFQEIDDALNQKLSAMMREGPDAELTLTSNAQPAIMANAIATLRVLEKDFGVKLKDAASCVAGHSLGEYTALAAVNAFSLGDTAKLLRLRGIAMQDAVPIGVGGMVALLGSDIETAQKLADEAAQGQVCEIANDNDPSQVVLSGHAEAIERVLQTAKDFGVKRAVRIQVSAPFHCSLMKPAAQRMQLALENTSPSALDLPLYANVSAAKVADSKEEQKLLVEQITGRVRWRESVLAMRADGVEHFVELGGKVLGPMVLRTDKDAKVASCITMEDLEAVAKEIG